MGVDPVQPMQHVGNLIGVDPPDLPAIHVSYLEKAVDLRVSGTSLAEDHLTHPPIGAFLLSNWCHVLNHHELSWIDA